MPGPSILDFALMADACYYAEERYVPAYTRVLYGQLTSGFKASRYALKSSNGLLTVVCFAGTDSDDTEHTDSGDKLSDLGFAGPTVSKIAGFVSPALGLAVAAGTDRLVAQIAGAVEFVKQATHFAGSKGTVYVTGHSLGGGLAQILCAQTGLQGVAFNGPTVSQMGYSLRDPSRFLNVNQCNDPVSSGTKLIGKHLGRVQEIDSGANVFKAHFLGPIIQYLQSGNGAAIGATCPF